MCGLHLILLVVFCIKLICCFPHKDLCLQSQKKYIRRTTTLRQKHKQPGFFELDLSSKRWLGRCQSCVESPANASDGSHTGIKTKKNTLSHPRARMPSHTHKGRLCIIPFARVARVCEMWNGPHPATATFPRPSTHIYTDTQPLRWHWAQASCLHITLLDPLIKNTHTHNQSHSSLLSAWLHAIHLTVSSSMSPTSHHGLFKGPTSSAVPFCTDQWKGLDERHWVRTALGIGSYYLMAIVNAM